MKDPKIINNPPTVSITVGNSLKIIKASNIGNIMSRSIITPPFWAFTFSNPL